MRLPVVGRRLRVVVALAVALCILAASVVDPPSAGGPEQVALLGIASDKWLHALAYAGLAGVLAYATLAADARDVALVVALAVGYGVGVEVVQAFLPLRTFDLADMGANATGAVVAGVGWRTLGTRLVERQR